MHLRKRAARAAGEAAVLSMFAIATQAVGGPGYGLIGSYAAPISGPLDVMSDGRLTSIDGSGQIHMQDGLNSSSFSIAGSIDPALLSEFGASFIRVNPSSTTIAIGDNVFGAGARVHLVEVSDLDPSGIAPVRSIESPNFDAAWADDELLYVSGSGAGSVITEVDTDDQSTRVVVDNIGGASAGVAVRDGNLFTGNGFDFFPGSDSTTGDVRAFDLDDFMATPVDFEAGGLPIANALSAGSLGFDGIGNLIIAGGDFVDQNEFGFVAIVEASAVEDALMGAGPAPDGAEQHVSPDGMQFYTALFNPVTEEILVTYAGADRIWRYAIPAPSVSLVLGFGLVRLGSRRRSALAWRV